MKGERDGKAAAAEAEAKRYFERVTQPQQWRQVVHVDTRQPPRRSAPRHRPPRRHRSRSRGGLASDHARLALLREGEGAVEPEEADGAVAEALVVAAAVSAALGGALLPPAHRPHVDGGGAGQRRASGQRRIGARAASVAHRRRVAHAAYGLTWRLECGAIAAATA